jgi:hypothetical protein
MTPPEPLFKPIGSPISVAASKPKITQVDIDRAIQLAHPSLKPFLKAKRRNIQA